MDFSSFNKDLFFVVARGATRVYNTAIKVHYVSTNGVWSQFSRLVIGTKNHVAMGFFEVLLYNTCFYSNLRFSDAKKGLQN